MSLSMAPYASGSVLPPDVVSPELVLVDESLAQRARSALNGTTDTLSRIESLPRREALEPVTLVRRSSERPGSRGVDRVDLRRLLPSTRRGRLRASGLVVASVCGLILLLPQGDGKHWDAPAETSPGQATTGALPGAPPTGTRSTPPSGKATPGQGAGRTATRSRPTRQRSAQRFAWAPVKGASGYHAELFRGSSLVFATETTKAEMVVPSVWKLDGERRRLTPGEYRWLVWAKVDGVRQSNAVVQARLVIPAG